MLRSSLGWFYQVWSRSASLSVPDL